MYGIGSEFDGNSAFAGGGFMPSQATQTADHSFPPARSRDSLGLIPLTVKQISEAPRNDKGHLVVDGVELSNVKFVGMVTNKTERVTDVGFLLDDGTGKLIVHRWTNEAVDQKEMENIVDGMYVKVHGKLNDFQGKAQLVAFVVRPLTDFNELTYHFIECAYVHLYNTKLQKASVVSDANATSSANGNPCNGYQTMLQNQLSGQYGGDALKGIDQRVMDYLQQPSNLAREKGVHRDEIAQRLNLPVGKIMESIQALENDGLVYSTIDECHYKSTGNG